MNDITSTITKPLAVLGENGSGYTKEANFVSWNGNDAKLDIRIWYPGHERCGKGVTLTEDEGRNLFEELKEIYEPEQFFQPAERVFETWHIKFRLMGSMSWKIAILILR